MTNLLPPAAKKQIVFEYWTRVICAWVVVWSIALALGSVLLLPTYVLLTGSNDAYAESATAATERTTEFRDLSRHLTEASSQASQLVALTERPRLSAVMAAVWGSVDPRRIEVTELNLQPTDQVLASFFVEGVAVDRQALADFRDQLETLPFVDQVDLPIANLAKNENIPFSLVVTTIPAEL